MYFCVVVYDIPCDKRRQKVFNLLSGYGKWVQYSVFECALSQRQFEELRTRLRGRVNLDESQFTFPRKGIETKILVFNGLRLRARVAIHFSPQGD
jgi:CRISPR-associated endonuclease Cas2